MLCQSCGENEASVRYTQIINGEKKEMVLCNCCSKKLGIDHIDLNMPIDFSSFFESILGDSGYDQEFMPIITKEKELRCPFCNMAYDEFVKGGKFGCSSCYDIFEDKIDSILKRIHGDNRYLGRKGKISDTNNIGAGHISARKRCEG